MFSQDYIVYLVDPDEAVHEALTALLRTSGTQLMRFSSAESFLTYEFAGTRMNGCLLVEASLPGMGSLALLKKLRSDGIDMPIIVLASTSNREIANQALNAGAMEVIEKPLLSDRILECLHSFSSCSDGAVAEPQNMPGQLN